MSEPNTERAAGWPDEGGRRAVRLVPAARQVPVAYDPYGPLPAPPVSGVKGPDNLAAELYEYLRVVNKRKWLILAILSSIVALGLVRTLMQTPLYLSTVRLQIDNAPSKVVEGGNIQASEGYQDYDFLKTQFELIQSRAMAERVSSSLKLGEDSDLFAPKGSSLFAALAGIFNRSQTEAGALKASFKDSEAASILLSSVTVRPVQGSRLVDVSYSDSNPNRAQRIANAYGEAFIAANLDKRFEANAYAKTFLEDQIKQLKLRLEESEKAQLDFAQKEQIVVTNEKYSIAEANLAAANTSLGSIVAERIKNEQLWRQVEGNDAINLPQLLTNAVIDGLRAKRNALVTEYQEKLETFKPSYPAMVQIDNKIKEIDRQLSTEVRTIRSSLKAAYESSVSQETETKARIETLRKEVIELQKRSIQYNIFKREADTNRELYNGLLQRFKEVDIAGGVGANNIFIVDKAQLPGAPYSPSLSRALILSVLLGLGVGIGAALSIENLDDTVETAEDVERITSHPGLGIIPRIAAGGEVEAELQNPRSAMSEAYRSLCTALQFSTEHGLPKSLLVTSAGPSEGKSITSLAIARHFAQMGQKVLLVDADLRNPSLHKKLRLDNSFGLSNYLTGGCTPPDAFQASPIANLAFMASGPLPPNAADILGGSRLHSLLSVGLEVFDLIVLDGPPVMGLADAQLLSNAAAATIFVVGSGQARAGLVRGSLKRLELGRAPVIGTVLTKFDARAAGYGYGYSYGYGYGYSYGANAEAAVEPSGGNLKITRSQQANH